MRSLVESPTRIVSSVWAGANAAIVDPGAAVLRRTASASYGAKNGFGRRTSGVVVAVSTRDWPAILTSLVAVLPLNVVWIVCACPRTVASSVSSSGFQLRSYRICSRRLTIFEWRVEPAGAGDRPASGVARHLALLGADHGPAREDLEGRFAISGLAVADAGCCAAADSGHRRGQNGKNDNCRADTMT